MPCIAPALSTRDEYLRELSSLVEQLQTTPGRLSQPADQASFDAWIRHYRPDENSPNVAMSYYTKGAVIAWLLDAKIRRATAGVQSLDTVMLRAYERFSGAKGFTEDEFRAVVSAVAGTSTAGWLTRVSGTTEEIDYRDALDWFGLRFGPSGPRALPEGQFLWQGLKLRTEEGRLLVSNVYRGTAAYGAGINVDDEILALGGFRVVPEQWETRTDMLNAGDKVAILLSRRDEIRTIDLTVAKEPALEWRLYPGAGTTDAQKRNLQDWLAVATAP